MFISVNFSDSVFNWATPPNSSGINRNNFQHASFTCSHTAAPILSSHNPGQIHWRPAHFPGAGTFGPSWDGCQQQQHSGRPARRISPPSPSLPPPSSPPYQSSSSALSLHGSLQPQLLVSLTVTWPSARPTSLLLSQCWYTWYWYVFVLILSILVVLVFFYRFIIFCLKRLDMHLCKFSIFVSLYFLSRLTLCLWPFIIISITYSLCSNWPCVGDCMQWAPSVAWVRDKNPRELKNLVSTLLVKAWIIF